MHLPVVRHNIAGVEHVENLHVDLRADVEVDEVLIAAQFGGTVAADLVVECGGFGVVEGVDCEVEDTVVLVVELGCLGVDVAVVLCGLHFESSSIADVVVAVEIAAVDALEVDNGEPGQR